MSTELKDLLIDVLSVVEPFRDEITHILMKRTEGGDIVAVAKSKDSNISITVMSSNDVPEFSGVACFGSLPYLGAVVKSKYLTGDNYSVEPAFDTASDGKTRALRSITFKGGKNKLEAFYQATDPFVNRLNKIKPPTIKEWPITFDIDSQFIKDFTEIQKVHRAAPKIGGDRDDIFTLAYNNGEIIAVFGERGHQSSMVLTEKAESSGQDKMGALLPVSHFQAILKLVAPAKGLGVAKFAEKALRVDITTDLATYSLMILSKKPSN